jgi:hypothetical protein
MVVESAPKFGAIKLRSRFATAAWRRAFFRYEERD